MAVSRRRVTRILALLVVAAIPLIPDPPVPVERIAELDTELVRSGEVRYRGITGNFDELTRAYALTAFENSELLGWEARPNPMNPETQALVTARFRVAGARTDSTAAGPGIPRLRHQVGETLEVTWKLNTLSSVHVTPHDDYARDALDVYRSTVDRLLDRMVFLIEATVLRKTPGAGDLTRLEAGTVLMHEARQDGWARVRVPSDTTAGWVPADLLRSVYGDDR